MKQGVGRVDVFYDRDLKRLLDTVESWGNLLLPVTVLGRLLMCAHGTLIFRPNRGTVCSAN